jgi:hypothetical protein
MGSTRPRPVDPLGALNLLPLLRSAGAATILALAMFLLVTECANLLSVHINFMRIV